MQAGLHQRTVKRAVIAAAGLGTRLFPLTRITPKPLLPVIDRPLVDYAISDVTVAGINEIFVLYDLPTFQRWQEVQDSYQLTSWDQVSFIAVQANGHHWGESLLELEHQLASEPFALVLASELFEHGGALLAEMITTFEETGCATVALSDRKAAEDLISLLNVKEACGTETVDSTQKVSQVGKGGLPPLVPGSDRDRFLGRYVLPSSFLKTLNETRTTDGKVNFFDALNKTALDGELLGIVCRNRHWAIRAPLDYLLATVDFGVDDFEYGPVLRRHLAVTLSRGRENGGGK